MVTMKDVALLAGVSVSTVSHVLNGTRNVAPETRDRVMRAVDALGYRPNMMARGLRRKGIFLLGLVVPDATNPYFAEVARAVEDRCYERGFSLMVASSGGIPEREARAVEAMGLHRVGGIIMVGLGFPEEQARILSGLEIPVVMVDRKIGDLPVDSIQSDNVGGGRMAARHLLDLGHRRIGCVTGPMGLGPSEDRLRGFMEEIEEARVDRSWVSVIHGDFGCESGYRAARGMLSRPDRPTAIFAMNDLMALGVMGAARDAGLSVPSDLSVVGFDGISMGRFFVPSLTTVAQPIASMGHGAVDRIVDRMMGDVEGEIMARILPCSLIQRGSSAPLGCGG
ncbi:transcriptional regulator, LacI family [Thermanaerovibrio acidaminovorans DSM 6589]|uniref:Transcriptional regulator, LacI family n=1 Tax=Thermanaerovibrio acidaminovorans (strain ATCC 49978 / DSM 6589 / Su883) TaxID=525903 RepID=D1B942_THEAS|nr:LacI family DNA-binding transcriptional regulator [Thermanaerovibrio acidaminovorans]ACZ18795.1 transcriptional regulator, LacI family [Thermanaerovibrio acidaminovorans DSM 6589]